MCQNAKIQNEPQHYRHRYRIQQAAFWPARSEEQAVLSTKFDNLKGMFCARFARYTRCLHGEENVLQTPSLIWRGICHRQPQQTNSQAAKLWKTAKPSGGLEIGGGIASNVVNVDPPDPLTATLWDVQHEFQVCQAAKQSYEKEKDFSVMPNLKPLKPCSSCNQKLEAVITLKDKNKNC